jgi:transcriptional regulator with XRE-family HTH domain
MRAIVESSGMRLVVAKSSPREYRLRAGWTQEDLSQGCGVSMHAISMLEAGRRRPRLSTVTKLATGLALDDNGCDQLIAATRGEREQTPPPGVQRHSFPAGMAGVTDPLVPAIATAPHQLPAAIRHFTGRLDE